MTRSPNAPPSAPWLGRLQLALVAALVFVAGSFAGLSLAGRIHLGTADKPEEKAAKAEKPATVAGDKAEGGRYQIEQMADARDLLTRAGANAFLGTRPFDTWAFKYRGGYLETKIEAEFEGESTSEGSIPQDWSRLLGHESSQEEGQDTSLDRSGFILLVAARPAVSVNEALSPYHAHYGGLLAFAPLGRPAHVLPPLFLGVSQRRLYRVFLTAAPPANVTGGGFNLAAEQWVRVFSPLVERDPADEEARAGGGKDLQAGKEVLLLDRQRGHSRVRLKARFLTDDEVRGHLPK